MVITEALTALRDYVYPPHCQRQAATRFIFVGPALLLILHSALLFHPPRRGPSWLIRNNAQAMRVALTIPIVVYCAHVTLAFHSGDINLLGYTGQSTNFVVAIFGLQAVFKSLEIAILTERPRLAHSDQRQEGSSDAHSASSAISTQGGTRPPHPFFFPHTCIPLFVDFAGSLRGPGWEWGVASLAGYGMPKGKSPPKTLRDPATVAFLKSRLLTVLLCCATVDFVDNIASLPATYASFDAYPSVLAPVNPLKAVSAWRRAIVQAALVLFIGAGVVAPIQGGFALMSLISTLISPQTQTWWDPLPFNNPLHATSLQRLWAVHWHALFRRTWYVFGYLPAAKITQKLGLSKPASRDVAVFAVFLLSGLFHEIGQHGMRRSSALDLRTGDFLDRTLLRDESGQCYPLNNATKGFGAQGFALTRFFLSQAVGLALEKYYTRWMGRGVGGWQGRIWTAAFVGLTGRAAFASSIQHGFMEGIAGTKTTRSLANGLVQLLLRYVGGVQ
ncbi:unnamed protein product [Jaminaea pallidilutea]